MGPDQGLWLGLLRTEFGNLRRALSWDYERAIAALEEAKALYKDLGDSSGTALEEAHRGLMRSQAAMGERGRALRHYEELVRLLGEQLGASPAPETRALYEGLREGRSGE